MLRGGFGGWGLLFYNWPFKFSCVKGCWSWIFGIHTLELGFSDVPHKIHDTHSHDFACDLSDFFSRLVSFDECAFFPLSPLSKRFFDDWKAWTLQFASLLHEFFSRNHNRFVCFERPVEFDFFIFWKGSPPMQWRRKHFICISRILLLLSLLKLQVCVCDERSTRSLNYIWERLWNLIALKLVQQWVLNIWKVLRTS